MQSPEHQTQPGQPCQTGLGQQHPPSSQDNQCKMGQDRLFFMTDSSFLLLSSASNSFSQSYSRLAQKSPSLFPPKSPEKYYAGAIYPDFTEINRALTNFFPSQVLQPLGKETHRVLGQPERRIQIFVSALGPSLLRGKVEPRGQEQKCSAFLTGMDVIIMPPSSATAMDLSPWQGVCSQDCIDSQSLIYFLLILSKNSEEVDGILLCFIGCFGKRD